MAVAANRRIRRDVEQHPVPRGHPLELAPLLGLEPLDSKPQVLGDAVIFRIANNHPKVGWHKDLRPAARPTNMITRQAVLILARVRHSNPSYWNPPLAGPGKKPIIFSREIRPGSSDPGS